MGMQPKIFFSPARGEGSAVACPNAHMRLPCPRGGGGPKFLFCVFAQSFFRILYAEVFLPERPVVAP
jgi:hypothetical protein